MEAFTTFTAVAAPYYLPDIDTDKIIPHRFLRKPPSAGYRNFLFYNERFTPEGEMKPFILHRAPYDKAGILVAGSNFGCGSTREGAVYALADFGFRTIIAPSFGDVFQSNCLQNGLLPVVLPEAVVSALAKHAEQQPGALVSIDLPAQTVTTPNGQKHKFTIDASRKEQLLRGLDDIGITLTDAQAIEEFERNYHGRLPWLQATGNPS
jgi:3-isopropylmalate/(R)-2-methylmalate dehydratase small subunit